MIRIIASISMALLFYPVTNTWCAVNGYAGIWRAIDAIQGSLSYNGGMMSNFTGKINSVTGGAWECVYNDCNYSYNTTVWYRKEDHWLFLPTEITVGGKVGKVTISEYSGYTYQGIKGSREDSIS